MHTIDILGDNRFDAYTKTREGSRGIVIDGQNRILLSWERNTDIWMIPGGGLEDGETKEACCVRELREETGWTVQPLQQVVTLHEYYEEYRYITHFFLCRPIALGEQSLTDAEKRRGLTPTWVTVPQALGIFSRHAEYAAENEEKRGIYLREYTALKKWLSEKD